jgi:hypothetical protein
MIYKVTSDYRLLLERGPVKVFYFHGTPFTWDDLLKAERGDEEVIRQLSENETITLEEINNGSSYLIAEELHPLIFDIPLDVDSVLPDSVFLDD